jgi:hypothetical protein
VVVENPLHPSGGGGGGGARLSAPPAVAKPPLVHTPAQLRARTRWHLAVLLLRNPSLRDYRKSREEGEGL